MEQKLLNLDTVLISDEKENTEDFIREENFDNYCDFVNAMTTNGKTINPKDLLYKLGYEKLDIETMGLFLTGQYKVAAAKHVCIVWPVLIEPIATSNSFNQENSQSQQLNFYHDVFSFNNPQEKRFFKRIV